MSITLVIIVITVLFSMQGYNDPAFFQRFMHHPYTEYRHKEYYRWLTSGFLHDRSSYVHLGLNMFVLWSFGSHVEKIYQQHFGGTSGSILFLVMYLSAIIAGNLITFTKHKDDPQYSAIGASGGVAGVLFASVLFDPWSIIELYFFIKLPAIVFGVLYLVYEEWASRKSNDNIGHDAHFFGGIAGMVITIILEPKIYSDFIHQLLHESPYWVF